MDISQRNIRTVLGKMLQFYGDTFCAFALFLEGAWSGKIGNVIVTKISYCFRKLGHWFYEKADKYAWSYLMSPNDFPSKRYGH